MRSLIHQSKLFTETARITKVVRSSEQAYLKAKGKSDSTAGISFLTSAPSLGIHQLTDLQAFYNFLLDVPEELLSAEDRFADYGCGFGGPSFVARNYFSSVTGIEFDEDMLEMAMANGLALGNSYKSVEFLNANFLKIDPRIFDVIYTFWPVANTDIDGEMRDCLEKSKQNTKVILHTLSYPSKYLHIFQGLFEEIVRGGSEFQRFMLFARI
jgi:SAM-dependent methyltransferase